MTVDTSGIGGYAVISTPLQQATGSGIVSVPLPDAVKNAKLTGSPEVAITGGGGTGAQAYADFDSTTRKVTGVHVICPGWDYETAPTATFKMGSVTLGTSTCAIAANKPGRLIKKGANTLRLNAVNTYTGDTVLEGGTLQATVEGAIPAKTRVVFAGGVMNCGSYTKPTKYAIDLKQVKASGAPVAYNTALSFPVGSTLELIDGGTLSEGDPTKIVLFKMGSGAVLSGTENVTLTGVDTKNWHLAWTGDSLKVVKNLGTIITIR